MGTTTLQVVEAPVLVVGSWRSGTTLMRSLLWSRLGVAVAPETHFVDLLGEWAVGDDPDAPDDFDLFWERFTSSMRFRDAGVDAATARALVDGWGRYTYADALGALLETFRRSAGKDRAGEKTPGHALHLPMLLRWFPGAQVVFMCRDPRAAIASKLLMPQVAHLIGRSSLRHGLVRGTRLHRLPHEIDEQWRRTYEEVAPRWVDDPRVHLVRYEDLVVDPDRVLVDLADFLDQPLTLPVPEDEPVAPSDTHEVDRFEQWRREHYRAANAPVATDSLDRWRDRLSRVEVAMIEGRCRDGMALWGYRPSVPAWQARIGALLVDLVPRLVRVERGFRRVVRRVLGRGD